MDESTWVSPIRKATFKEQYTCLMFLYYLRTLFEGAKEVFHRDDILQILAMCKEDDDVFDQHVVAVFDQAEAEAERREIERDNN